MHKERKTSEVHVDSRKLTKKCAMKMKQTNKEEKIMRMYDGRSVVYRAFVEN